MRHLVSGRKLQRTSSHRKALLRNLATALFEHKKLETTSAKAKELRPYAEKLISKAKRALQKEKQGLLPQGQTLDVHSRRVVGRHLESKAVVQELFDTIAPMVQERPGGYCRIIKTGFRRGDGGETSIIELVDWSNPVDGTISIKSKKKAQANRQPKAAKNAEKTTAPVAEKAPKAEEKAPAVEEVAEQPAVADEPVADAAAETADDFKIVEKTDDKKEEQA